MESDREGEGRVVGSGGAVGGVRVFPRGDMEGGLGRSGWMASWAVWPSWPGGPLLSFIL